MRIAVAPSMMADSSTCLQATQITDLWSAALGLQRQEGREAALNAALDLLAWSGATSSSPGAGSAP